MHTKKKLNKLLNTTLKHGLADHLGKRAVISTAYVTGVDDTGVRTENTPKHRSLSHKMRVWMAMLPLNTAVEGRQNL